MVFAFVFWVEATAKVRIIGLVFSFRLFIVPLIRTVHYNIPAEARAMLKVLGAMTQ